MMELRNITVVCASLCTSLYKFRSDRSFNNFCSFHLPPLSFAPTHTHTLWNQRRRTRLVLLKSLYFIGNIF